MIIVLRALFIIVCILMLLTPKKPAARGRNPKPESVNDFCRVCKLNLKVSRSSSENIFKPSERKESKGLVLAVSCRILGFRLEQSSSYSERVCQACGRKIRNAVENISFLRQKLNEAVCSNEESSSERQKRSLPTSVTPERRDVFRSRKGGKSAKQLFDKESFQESEESPDFSPIGEQDVAQLENIQNEIKIRQSIRDSLEDNIQRHFNIEAFDLSEKKESGVRVLIAYPSGDVVVKQEFDKLTTTLIRNIALKKWQTVANIIFKHKDIAKEIPDVVRRQISSEFQSLSSDSLLSGTSPDEIAAYSNKAFVHEVEIKCPLWYASINGAVGLDLRKDDERRKKAINSMALSTSTLARQRNPTMSALAYRISLVLFNGGLSHYDTVRLNHLGICMSPDMIVRLQKKMGKSSDSKVLLWKKTAEERHSALKLLQEVKAKQLPELQDDDMVIDITIEMDEEILKSYSSYCKPAYELCRKLIHNVLTKRGESSVTDSDIDDVIYMLQHHKLPQYRIVADNIDYHINARYQSRDRTNQSIHWTQQYAILDRVTDPNTDNTKPKKPLKDIQLIDLLPVQEVQEAFKKNCAVLVSRVITKHLSAFNHMQDVVIRHIPHPYSYKMAEKSEICCLGLQFKNPNISGEMAHLLQINQEKYVPKIPSSEYPEIVYRVPLHGDQLFEERARNAQWTFIDGTNPYDRLEGMITEMADWHAKVNLYSIEFEAFVNDQSAMEIGTSRASMNRVGKTRASQGVKKHYNEYKDFHECEVEAHICSSFMEMINMKDLNDVPDLDIPSKAVPKDERKVWLLKLCIAYVNKYLGGGEIDGLLNQVDRLQKSNQQGGFPCREPGCEAVYVHHSRRVRHEIESHNLYQEATGDGERDAQGFFFCRAGCGLVYSTKATRKRHEKTEHPAYIASITEDVAHEGEKESKETKDPQDYLFNYHRGKLAFGLLLLEFEDAVKEGDGNRLLNVYKFALLFYKNYGHDKYAYVTLFFLVNEHAALTKFQANSLKYNRFYNKYGLKGRNISLDLKMEQLNKVLKSLWRGLGANLNEKNAERVANSIEGLELVLDSIDKDCILPERQGYRSKGNSNGSVRQIVRDLMEKRVFQYTEFREGHPSFPKFSSDLLHGLDYRDLHKWITDLVKHWEAVLP